MSRVALALVVSGDPLDAGPPRGDGRLVPMTQLEAARQGVITPEMARVAERECVDPTFIRDEVARGRLVIPANVRHLAGSGGAAPTPANGHPRSYPATGLGHPGSIDARYWVNQTVAQRWTTIADPQHLKGERAPKRLDPTGIGRMITTKINANMGASPVSSGTEEEVEKLQLGGALGRRHGDGPVDRRRPRRVPRRRSSTTRRSRSARCRSTR